MNKMNIFLDLDETIISSVDNNEYLNNREKLDNLVELNSKKFDEEGEKFVYNVYERPHLQPFLEFIFKNFNVSVWTAASKNYALFIIDNFILNKERKLDYIFFDYHCGLSKKFKDDKHKIKSLDILSNDFNIGKINLKNTIIIDDNEKVLRNQPDNCIKIKPFDVIKDKNPKCDDELLRIKNHLELMLV